MFEFINDELAKLRTASLYRSLRSVEKINGSRLTIGGQEYLNFCSNDYLGLSQHPKVKEKAMAAIREFGFGAGASRLICGSTVIHGELEQRLAKLKKREAALVFPTGYLANLGAITALVNENDTVIIDRLNHASIIDACKLSKAKLQVYPHKDMLALEKILKRSAKFNKRLIVTDSVFSMDGDIAPVKTLVALGKKYQAITMVDDAHATGVVKYDGNPDIVMGTLSKALGSLGGFVAGHAELIDYLRNKARSFIFTTAIPPAACAAALAALDVIREQPELVRNLRINSRLLGSQTPIIPIVIGDNKKTLDISRQLFERGFFVSAIRPPAVPAGQSRLRITVTALHEKEEIACLACSLRELIPA